MQPLLSRRTYGLVVEIHLTREQRVLVELSLCQNVRNHLSRFELVIVSCIGDECWTNIVFTFTGIRNVLKTR